MAKSDQMLSSVEKLYAKRNALDKQINIAEKQLLGQVKIEIKAATSKPAAKKPAKPAAKPAPKKSASAIKKPLLKK